MSSINHDQWTELDSIYFPFADYIFRKSSLSARNIRIIVLRAAWLWCFEIEWAQHASIVVRDKLLSEDEVRRITLGTDAKGWTDLEMLLIKAVDQIHQTSEIDDSLRQSLTSHLSVRQMADLAFTIFLLG